MKKLTYTYCLFLKHPETNECKVHHISLDSLEKTYINAIDLFTRLSEFDEIDKEYTLINIAVINCKELVENEEEEL